MRSSNPTLSSSTFIGTSSYATSTEVMTIEGTVNKSAVLILCVLLTASLSWIMFFNNNPFVLPISIGGAVGGLIFALVTSFKKEWASITAPIYALLEGLFLGGVSAMLEAAFSGIVIQAVALTFGTFICLLLAYKSGVIKATENFKLGVVAATGAVALIYLATFVLGFFNIGIPYIHESGTVGIIFSIAVVVIAALNLVLDFDFIEQGSEMGAPKYMEWYAAFGLVVTLVWLYLEILKLLSKLARRD